MLALVGTCQGAGFAHSAPKQIVTQNFVIDYDDISDEVAAAVAREAGEALRSLKNYLKKDFDRTITIEIGNRFVLPQATAEDARIRVPSNRLTPGGAVVGLPPLLGRGMSFWSAVQNIIAPCRQIPADWGRFIGEGLGVYVQAKFGRRTHAPWPSVTYPAMGEDLDTATRKLAKEIGFLPLSDAVRHLNDRRETYARRLGWLQAGSFVGYIIETWGIDRFMQWYDQPIAFEAVYLIPIETAEKDWENKIMID